MAQKLRVYQVAKDFNVSSEALLGILEGLGQPAKSHMSTLDPSVVDLVREKFQEEKNAVKAEDARKQEAKAAIARGESKRSSSVAVASPPRPAPRTEPEAKTPAAPAKPPRTEAPQPPPERPAASEVKEEAPPAPPAPAAEAPAEEPKPATPSRPDRRRRRAADEQSTRDRVKKILDAVDTGPKKFKKKAETPAPKPAAKAKPEAAPRPAAEETPAGTVKVPELASVAELADRLGVKPMELMNKLIGLGNMVTINQRLDKESIEIVALEYGYEVKFEEDFGAEEIEEVEEQDRPEDLKERAPVVTVMGHVDHGKTSLLDYIRKASVVAGEKGGITQHIGAYEVEVAGGRHIAFLDTPGHEAFTAMRARGAKATDIVVLVVAADDRVMPQTLEAIDHAKAAEVPIVVAVNKIDKPDSRPDVVKQDLANNGVLVEQFGGQIPSADISAKTGKGIDDLLELILLQADLLELKANPDRRARGVVIESKVEQGRGIVATILVQNGTLSVGDPFVCGATYGKVRAMSNERGKRVKEAGPSTPVEVTGWNDTPNAGDVLAVTESDAQARDVGQKRAIISREAQHRASPHVRLTDIHKFIEAGEIQELRLIIKADVAGSAEVLSEQLSSLGTDEVTTRVLHSGVGQIVESDVDLADASDAIIIGFNVKIDPKAHQAASSSKVDVRIYNIIYEAVEDVKSALAGLLKPEEVEKVAARIEVRKVFRISKAGSIAGCYVTEGTVRRSNRARLIRDGETVFDGRIGSLKRFKDDVREVAQGFECGIGLDGHDDVREGDVIEAYTIEEVARRL